jgi:hypothetical protein
VHGRFARSIGHRQTLTKPAARPRNILVLQLRVRAGAMPPPDVLPRLRSASLDVFAGQGVQLAYLFGSRPRGAAGPGSDVDVAVHFSDDVPAQYDGRQPWAPRPSARTLIPLATLTPLWRHRDAGRSG